MRTTNKFIQERDKVYKTQKRRKIIKFCKKHHICYPKDKEVFKLWVIQALSKLNPSTIYFYEFSPNFKLFTTFT